jgi:hypothetical protein
VKRGEERNKEGYDSGYRVTVERLKGRVKWMRRKNRDRNRDRRGR